MPTSKDKMMGVWDKGIRWLGPVLHEWVACIERYGLDADGDAAYWHSRVADLHLLGCAAWQAGVLSLAGHAQDPAKTADSLYIKAKKHEAVIVGQRRLVMLGDDDPVAVLDRSMVDAHIGHHGGVSRIGAVFMTPVADCALSPTEVQASLGELVESLMTVAGDGFDGMAWAFPAIQAARVAPNGEGDQRVQWPGIVLALKLFQ